VLFLHDASDIPIDAMRVAQKMEMKVGLYLSVGAVLVSWAILRLYVFPVHVILSAVKDSGEMWEVFGDNGGTKSGVGVGVPSWGITLGYVIEVTPLAVLWGLSCWWYSIIVSKVLDEVKRGGEGRGEA